MDKYVILYYIVNQDTLDLEKVALIHLVSSEIVIITNEDDFNKIKNSLLVHNKLKVKSFLDISTILPFLYSKEELDRIENLSLLSKGECEYIYRVKENKVEYCSNKSFIYLNLLCNKLLSNFPLKVRLDGAETLKLDSLGLDKLTIYSCGTAYLIINDNIETVIIPNNVKWLLIRGNYNKLMLENLILPKELIAISINDLGDAYCVVNNIVLSKKTKFIGDKYQYEGDSYLKKFPKLKVTYLEDL